MSLKVGLTVNALQWRFVPGTNRPLVRVDHMTNSLETFRHSYMNFRTGYSML